MSELAIPKTINWRLFVYTRKNLLLGIGAVFAAFLIVTLAIWPQIDTIITTREKLSKEQKELQKVSSKLQELEAIKISDDFAQADRVNLVLPSKKPLLEFMTGLNAIAANTTVIITDLKVAPGQIATDSSSLKAAQRQNNKSAYESLELSISVSGQLADIQKFLTLIEQISPMTTITKINLNRKVSAEDSSSSITKAELDLTVHYFVQQISTSVTAPLPQISQRERDIFKTLNEFTIPQTNIPTDIQGGGNPNPFLVDPVE